MLRTVSVKVIMISVPQTPPLRPQYIDITVASLDDLVFVGVPIRGPIAGKGPASLAASRWGGVRVRVGRIVMMI